MQVLFVGALVAQAVMLSPNASAIADSSARVGIITSHEDGGNTWLQWRGPNRDGQFVGPEWPSELSEETLELRWRIADLGPSYAGPMITESTVVTVETRAESEEVAQAFDRVTGGLVWEAKWDGAMEGPAMAGKNGSWIRSTPACDGESLFIGGIRDVLVCLDVESGGERWRADFLGRFSVPVPMFGLVCSPIVTDEYVFVQAGGGFQKLEKRTGETVWRVLIDGNGSGGGAFSSPAMATLDGVEQVLVQTRGDLCGVDPEDGSVLWRRSVKASSGMNILTPAVYDDGIFTSSYGGRAVMLDIVDSEGSFVTNERWSNRIQGYMSSPVIIDDHAYLFTRSNRFACINLETGEEAWISPPTGDKYWSLVAQGDRILALSDTGLLRLIEADPAAYSVVGEVRVSDEETWAHLAVAGQDIVIRELHALSVFSWATSEN